MKRIKIEACPLKEKCTHCDGTGQKCDLIKVAYFQINTGLGCTSECGHCLQDAGPKRKEHMSLDTAKRTRVLIDQLDETMPLLVYGGELICHPQWQEVLELLIGGLPAGQPVHIYSNGDWVKNHLLAERFLGTLDRLVPYGVKLRMSSDEFHDTDVYCQACEFVEAWQKKTGSKIVLGNVRDEEGFWEVQSLISAELGALAMGRAIQFPCALSAREVRCDTCAYLTEKDGDKEQAQVCFNITFEGSIWRSSCGVGRLGNVHEIEASQLGKLWSDAWQAAKETEINSCEECFKVANGDCAWRTRYAPAGVLATR